MTEAPSESSHQQSFMSLSGAPQPEGKQKEICGRLRAGGLSGRLDVPPPLKTLTIAYHHHLHHHHWDELGGSTHPPPAVHHHLQLFTLTL